MTDEQTERLITALERLSTGDSEPRGLEAVVMALAGEDIATPVGEALSTELFRVAQALGDENNPVGGGLYAIADALERMTEVLGANYTGAAIKAGLLDVGAAIREGRSR